MSRKSRVLIHAHDPASGIGPDGPLVGFWTACFVEADDRETAARISIDLIAQDQHVRDTVRDEGWVGTPVISATEVDEVDSFDGVRLPRAGLGLYDEREPQ